MATFQGLCSLNDFSLFGDEHHGPDGSFYPNPMSAWINSALQGSVRQGSHQISTAHTEALAVSPNDSFADTPELHNGRQYSLYVPQTSPNLGHSAVSGPIYPVAPYFAPMPGMNDYQKPSLEVTVTPRLWYPSVSHTQAATPTFNVESSFNSGKIDTSTRVKVDVRTLRRKPASKSRSTRKGIATAAPREYGTFQSLFFDWNTAKAHLRQPKWTTPTDDATIPTTLQEKLYWVEQLRASMINLNGIKDRTTSWQRPRWEDRIYEEVDIQAACWNVLKQTIALHERGYSTLFEIPKRFANEALTCGARLRAICDTLRVWKSACSDVMDGMKIPQLVNAPLKRATRSSNNKGGNEKKTRLLKEARPPSQRNTRTNRKRTNRGTSLLSDASVDLDVALTSNNTHLVPAAMRQQSTSDPRNSTTLGKRRAREADKDEHDDPSWSNEGAARKRVRHNL